MFFTIFTADDEVLPDFGLAACYGIRLSKPLVKYRFISNDVQPIRGSSFPVIQAVFSTNRVLLATCEYPPERFLLRLPPPHLSQDAPGSRALGAWPVRN